MSVGATHVKVTLLAGLEVPPGVPAAVIVDPVLLLSEHAPRTKAKTNKLVSRSCVAVPPNLCMLSLV